MQNPSLKSASFSPDGKSIVTASYDITAIVWDAATGQQLRTLAGHTGSVYSASFSPNGKHIVTASEDKTAIVWDAATGQQLRTLAGHTGSVNSASFSPDGKYVVTASNDGTTRLWDGATGQELCSMLSFDHAREWLVVTPEGYYQGSLAAEQYIRWRVESEDGGWPRLFGPEQFRDTFYRPDLFRYLLAEGNVYKALARAYGPTQPTTIAREIPPIVVVRDPKNHAKVEQANLRVEVIVKSVGVHPVESLRVELNGRPVGSIERVKPPKSEQFEHAISLELEPGENSVKVLARAGGSVGYSDPIKVTYLTRDQVKARLHILAIGLDKYSLKDPKAGGFPELHEAASGARKVGEAFAHHGGSLYEEVLPPVVLLDEKATRKAILASLARFCHDITKDDVGVFYYAGHATKDETNNQLYLTAHDTDQRELVSDGVSAAQVRNLLASNKGRIYLFLDACQSGAIIEDMVRELQPRATGIVIVTACRGDEASNENGEFGGFFTHALVEGLSGKASSPDGIVYPYALMGYVATEVKKLAFEQGSPKPQTPYYEGSSELMNAPLAKP